MFRSLTLKQSEIELRRIEIVPLSIAVALMSLLCTIEAALFDKGIVRSANEVIFHSIDTFAMAVAIIYFAIGQVILVGLIYLSLISKLLTRLITTLLVAVALFIEFSYLRALGRYTIPFDVTAALTATGEQQVDSLLGYASFAWLPFIAIVVASSLFVGKNRNRHGLRSLGIWVLIAVIYYAQLAVLAPLLVGQNFTSSSFDAFAQTTAGFLLTKPAEMLSPPVRQQVPAFENYPTNNVIVIFDESIRADHLSLNGYKRPTTPYLEELARKRQLINWGTAVSASTSSHPSYDTFIAGATPDLVASRSREEINRLPTIFQYAKAMNFKTYYIDGQMKHYWGGIEDDLKYIDSMIDLNTIDPGRIENYERGGSQTAEEDRVGLKQWEIDQKLAVLVREIFTGSSGNFVFVYKRGVHFPYEKNFPKDNMNWEPIYYFKNQWEVPPAEAHNGIVNSYDNSIAYNLDSFFKELFGDGTQLPSNTVIVYTSDHGESFFTGGKAGHGGDSKEEATVPLFMFGVTDQKMDTKFPASHANIFTTLLDLIKYPESDRMEKYALSLFSATQKDAEPRSFNRTDGKKIAYD